MAGFACTVTPKGAASIPSTGEECPVKMPFDAAIIARVDPLIMDAKAGALVTVNDEAVASPIG